jgi:hypothetical protein
MQADAPFTEEQRMAASTVAKMLQLGKKNPNAQEAAVAVKKAMELALKWNLDVEAIGAQGDEGTRLKDRIKGGWYEWQVDIWRYVAELNFCLYYRAGEWRERDRRYGWKNADGTWATYQENYWQKLHGLVGKKHNVAATRAMAEYLEQAVERELMERLGNDNTQRFSNWAHSWRKGAVEDITTRLYERRKHLLAEEARKAREAEARAAAAGMAGAPSGTSLAIASLVQTERDSNMDEYLDRAPGTTARLNAERIALRAAEAEARRIADEEHTRWAAEHPEEAAEEARRAREERAKRDAKEAGSSYRSSAGPRDTTDWGAFSSGKSAGAKIGLDVQAGGFKSAGSLR